MTQEELSDGNFKNFKVIYESKEFKIAYGEFNTEGYYLGMRWFHNNGIGYPNSKKGKPQWFMLEKGLELPILTHLLSLNNNPTRKEDIKKVINMVLNTSN